MNESLGKILKIKLLAHSEAKFNLIARDVSTKAKILVKGFKDTRYEYNNGIIEDVALSRRKYSLADSMVQGTALPRFIKAIEKSQLHQEVENLSKSQ